MKLLKYLSIAGMLVAAVVALHSCASSTMLVDVWHDTAYNAPAISKVLVISVAKDPIRRRLWEDAFTTELSRYTVAATPLYRQYPESLPDSAQVGAAVRSGGYEGFLVIRRIPQEKEVINVSEYVSTQAETRYNRFLRRYETYYEDVLHPGYIDTMIYERRTVDLWVTGDKPHIVWTGTSRTPVPAPSDELRSNVISAVLSVLAQYALIPGKK